MLYQNETVPAYHERIVERIESYLTSPPAKQRIISGDGKSVVDFSDLSAELIIGCD